MSRARRGRLRIADLAATAASVGLARELLRSWVVAHRRLDDAVLLASETVTNAVRYGCTRDGAGVVRLVVQWTGARIYVAVTDEGAGATTPHIAEASDDSVAGRGLMLVDAIADRWDATRAASGRRRVWFELVAR